MKCEDICIETTGEEKGIGGEMGKKSNNNVI